MEKETDKYWRNYKNECHWKSFFNYVKSNLLRYKVPTTSLYNYINDEHANIIFNKIISTQCSGFVDVPSQQFTDRFPQEDSESEPI